MATAQGIDLAYETWLACGQNLVKTASALSREHGFDVTRQTLSSWRDTYDWEGRAARAENEAREQRSAISDDALIGSLLNQKKAYEDYFNSLPKGKVDIQATYGYNCILRTIIEIKQADEQRRRAGNAPVAPGEQRAIKTPAEAVDALQEAIERKINVMLANPDTISLRPLQEMEKALAMIEKMRTAYAPEKEGKSSTDEDRQRLVEEVDRLLGVK